MDLAIDRRAAVQRVALGDGSSWVDLVEGFVPDAEALYAEVHEVVRWHQNEVLRYDSYVPEQRLSGALRPDGPPVAVRQTSLHLESTYRVRFDGVAALHYRDGSDFQGLHSDREMKWLDETLIAVLVLGARRPFVLRERGPSVNHADRRPAGSAPDDVVLRPGHGDLLVMGGRCQRDWLHGIPAADTAEGRISLMWRWTSRRGRPDTLPSYFDGRQYSDRVRQPGTRRVHRGPAGGAL